jgi:Domain of unknown function (DUF4226)
VSGTKHFDDLTHWDQQTARWSWRGGWQPPGKDFVISHTDPYWSGVLDRARAAYGDPNIHFNTDDFNQERHLVFGDGTKLPENGMVVYHDSGTKQNWAQNDDGTVSPVGPDGNLGAPIAPTGYRPADGGKYAPIDARGNQIAPLAGGMPPSNNGFYTDPKTGILTPKNANGDYFTVGPDGKKSFFDKNGAPISEAQFNNANRPRDPAQPQPGPGLPTDEQQSGKAADAVKKLQGELKNHYSTLSDAEEKLSEVLLNAHATTSAGRDQLNDIQQKIVDAVNNPTMAMDTPAGERSFLTFLRSQVSEINGVLTSGALSAEDQGKAALALAALYAAGGGAGPGGDPSTQQPSGPPSPASGTPGPDPATTPGPAADPGIADPGLGPAPAMPDPSMSDLLGGGPLGADPMSSLASMLPGALSGLGGLGGAGAGPLDGLGGLAGAAAPLAGLASGLGDPGNHGHASDQTEKPADDTTGHSKDDKGDKTDPAKTDTTTPPPGNQQPAGQQDQQNPNTTPGAGGPPAPLAPPGTPPTTVKLPDGSTATARTPQAAQAIRDYLAGSTIDSAYRQNGIQLPPPGTPVINPVDPTRVTCGDVAMFKDHYVPVLSSVKAFLNGQVVPLGSVSSSPDFLGFIDPTAAAAAAGSPPPPPAPAWPPAASPAGVAAPVPAG